MLLLVCVFVSHTVSRMVQSVSWRSHVITKETCHPSGFFLKEKKTDVYQLAHGGNVTVIATTIHLTSMCGG